MGASLSSTVMVHDPTPHDVAAVRRALLQLLPRELVDKVLDCAQYWVMESVSTNEEIRVGAGWGQDKYGEQAILDTDITSPVSSSSVWLNPARVKTVKFVIESHDQGWGGERRHQGTYVACWSWWEASILRPHNHDTHDMREVSFGGSTRFHLQNNVHVSNEYHRHEIVWTDEDLPSDESDDRSGRLGTGRGIGRGFVNALQMGDRISLIAIAQYPGWANHVRLAEIEVYYSI